MFLLTDSDRVEAVYSSGVQWLHGQDDDDAAALHRIEE
jgi:hypothetical protein